MDILKKHGMEKCDTVSTPMATTKLDADLQGALVDQTKYRSMIRGIMYFTASRPDIAFATFGVHDELQKHIRRAFQFLGDKLVSWSSKKQDYTAMASAKAEYVGIPALPDLLIKPFQRERFEFLFHKIVETPENLFVAPANIHTIEVLMNRVGYQGVVDKVSAFFTKNLAQPWQTMFKVFNRCLTTRTSGHDQTKINILQLFHVVLNQTHVDYAALLCVYTMGNVLVRGMLISYSFLTVEIQETNDFKEYETVFMKVDVPMNQPQPVVSTQGTNRNTPRSSRTPTVSASPQESKKRKQTAGESSSRRIIIKKKKQNTPSIPPPGDDRERVKMAEATILSLTLHKTALDAEAKENISKVQEMLEQEEIDKLVDGDEDKESYASAFSDTMLNNDDDDTRSKLKPGSHKDHPEHVSSSDSARCFICSGVMLCILRRLIRNSKCSPANALVKISAS
ncbi:hypothetical protein Tco_1485706 [Tanacetum coccineum]